MGKKINSTKTLEVIMKSGLSSQFWQEGIKKVISDWIEELKQDILFRDDLSQRIEISRRDLLRLQMKSFMDLLEIPQTIIEDLEEDVNPQKPDLRVYFENIKDLKND